MGHLAMEILTKCWITDWLLLCVLVDVCSLHCSLDFSCTLCYLCVGVHSLIQIKCLLKKSHWIQYDNECLSLCL